jgi:hypothetical protein
MTWHACKTPCILSEWIATSVSWLVCPAGGKVDLTEGPHQPTLLFNASARGQVGYTTRLTSITATVAWLPSKGIHYGHPLAWCCIDKQTDGGWS